MDPSLTPILTAIVGFVAGVTGAVITQWNQGRLESRRDARALRDARRERLRLAIQELGEAAVLIRRTANQLSFTFTAEAVEASQRTLQALWNTPRTGIDAISVRLLIEADGRDLLAGFDELWRLYVDLESRIRDGAESATSVSHVEIGKLRDRICQKVDELLDASRERLDKLDRPI